MWRDSWPPGPREWLLLLIAVGSGFALSVMVLKKPERDCRPVFVVMAEEVGPL